LKSHKVVLITYPDDFILNEAKQLVLSIPEYEIAKVFTQKYLNHAKYGIGSGKAEEIETFVKETKEIAEIIVDEHLTSKQIFNLENLTGVPVKDRERLKNHKVDPEKLVLTKVLTKDYDKYDRTRNTLENNALRQLELNGEYLKAGQILQYIIIDNSTSKAKNRRRVLPLKLLENNDNNYDVKRYSKLLIDTCNTLIEPFGIVFDRNLQSLYRLDNYY
jgi:DNA polymerase elongation subunit (family B)